MNGEEVTLAEVARAIHRLEMAVEKMSETTSEELRTLRHRQNNSDTIMAGYAQRFINVDERFLNMASSVKENRTDIEAIQKDQTEVARRQVYFLLGLLGEGALLVVSLVLAAQGAN